MIYLDTSALMSLILRDAHTGRIRTWFRDATPLFAVSLFSLVEFGGAIGVRRRMSAINTEQAHQAAAHFDKWIAAQATMIPIEPQDFHAAASFVRRFDLGLRAPDALHIAICRRLGLALLTFDTRQASAARQLGVVCDPAGAVD